MNFDTLRQETLASPLAAAVQGGASGLGRHARAETKLLLARAFGRLVGAFHKIRSVEPVKLTNPDIQSIPFPWIFKIRITGGPAWSCMGSLSGFQVAEEAQAADPAFAVMLDAGFHHACGGRIFAQRPTDAAFSWSL